MPGEFSALDLLLALLLGGFIVYMFWLSSRKKWFLESMNPRNEYELGREKKLLVNMTIHNKTFNGVKAGKYTVLLTHGSLSEYSKGIFSGKIEYIYAKVLSESLVAKKLVTPLEKSSFFSFIFERLPELTVKSYLLTGELVSPDHVINLWETENDRAEAWADLKRRKLIAPEVLWVNPYPPENKLKDIMSGVIMIPDILQENMKDLEGVTADFRNTVIQMNRSSSKLLTRVIPLARLIVSSISDATFVMGLILSDRASQIQGIGIAQLAERGGIEGQLEAIRTAIKNRDEFLKIMGGPLTKEEREKIEKIEKDLTEIKEFLKTFEKPKVTPPLITPGAK